MSSPPPDTASTLPSTPTFSRPPPYTLAHLDHLLTTYLTYLDKYTTHCTLLSTTLSTGFLQLAQAQRSAMLPPGQRYGQEMYDQRMKAGQRVRMVESRVDGEHTAEEDEGRRFELEVYTYPDAEENSIPTSTCTSTSTAQTQTETPPASTSTSPTPFNPIKPENTSKESPTLTQQNPRPTPTPTSSSSPHPPPPQTTTTTPKPTTNPLSQFATLPPPPLRSSQACFRSALANVPTLLNTSQTMCVLEAEIERVRRALGLGLEIEIETETETETKTEGTVADDGWKTELGTEKETAMEEGAADEGAEEGEITTATSPASLRRRGLASRSKMTEPRSRVLKLGT